MKYLFFLLAFFSAPILTAQVGFGDAEPINGNWKFILKDIDHGERMNLDDSPWETIDLPHDWSIQQPLSPTLSSATGYLPGGIGWYRKHLFIPNASAGKKIFLYFEGVYNRSEVFVNGVSLGKRPNGYISFLYDATPYMKLGEENLVAVRVDHSQFTDSRWYTGSGIYRNVWLVCSHPVHIAPWGVFAYPEKQKDGYVLTVEVEAINETGVASEITIHHELFAPDNKRVKETSDKLTLEALQKGKIQTAMNVQAPECWSVETPKLYTLKTTIYQQGQRVDETTTRTGFRHFVFDPDKGFALNEEWMKLKGVCLHHDAGVLGSAVPPEVWRRRLLTLKEIGVNAIRTSHNPQAPDVYRLCDELGLLVLDEAFDEWEFPKRKWIEGWNIGTPGYQGSYDFFDEWGEKDLEDMIRRDRNHLSIFAWSIGNEVDYPNDPYSHPVLDGGGETGFTQPIFGGYKEEAPNATRLGDIAKRLVKVVKQTDPSRPVTAGLAGIAMSNQTAYPFALDITGYNYTESLYDQDHAKYPDRVIFGSENRHDLEAWKAVTSRDFIFGQFLWTGIDYLGESGRWPSRGFYSGLLNFGGFIKPRGHFRRSLWSEKPMVTLGTYSVPERGRYRAPSMDAWPVWNYQKEQMIRVVCYTNANQAILYLNEKVIGEKKAYDEQTGMISWDIPYAPGKLEVIGLNNNGKQVCQEAINTSQQPYAIRILSGETTIKKGGVAQVVVQVVDENGIPAMLSNDLITCRIHGDARLLGLEAGNNTDMSDYTDNKHRVYHGRLIAYIKMGDTKEEVRVHFSANGLKPAEMNIIVQ
jgi:beta-galactosidase